MGDYMEITCHANNLIIIYIVICRLVNKIDKIEESQLVKSHFINFHVQYKWVSH